MVSVSAAPVLRTPATSKEPLLTGSILAVAVTIPSHNHVPSDGMNAPVMAARDWLILNVTSTEESRTSSVTAVASVPVYSNDATVPEPLVWVSVLPL